MGRTGVAVVDKWMTLPDSAAGRRTSPHWRTMVGSAGDCRTWSRSSAARRSTRVAGYRGSPVSGWRTAGKSVYRSENRRSAGRRATTVSGGRGSSSRRSDWAEGSSWPAGKAGASRVVAGC